MNQTALQQLSADELNALVNSPSGLLGAINALLQQIHVLEDRWYVLTKGVLDNAIPDAVAALGEEPQNGIVYLPSGMTAPRADGAVRIRAWDEFVANAQASSHEPTARWANGRAAQPWIFIQDTLHVPGITDTQRLTIGTNCANARVINGLLGGKFPFWAAYPLAPSDDVPRLGGEALADAFAVSDDLTFPDGRVRSRGCWAADMGMQAERSLAHFVLTSGRARKPI